MPSSGFTFGVVMLHALVKMGSECGISPGIVALCLVRWLNVSWKHKVYLFVIGLKTGLNPLRQGQNHNA